MMLCVYENDFFSFALALDLIIYKMFSDRKLRMFISPKEYTKDQIEAHTSVVAVQRL